MTLNDFSHFKRTLAEYNLLFCYNGYFSQDIIVSLSQMIKEKLILQETKMGISQKVLYMFVEQAQNIVRYSDEKMVDSDKEIRFGSLVVGMENEKFFIMCTNRIENTKVERFKERLNYIASLTTDELKALYKEKIRGEADEGSKGASIGFIEMARKASEPIEYKFVPLDEQMTCFYFKVII